MSIRSLKYLLFVSPFLLAACGEGYEMVRTAAYAPYGNARTAGTTIAYVQSKMIAEKKLKLEPMSTKEKVDQAAEKVKAVQAAETIKPPKEDKGDVKILKELENDLDTLFKQKLKK